MNKPFRSQPYNSSMGLAVPAVGVSSTDDLAQMEQSLAQIYKDNMTLMTQSLEQYKNEMIIFQKKYDMLREDYMYNLRVINERDEELRKCDTHISRLNASVVNMKEREREMQSQMAAINSQLADSVSKNNSLQKLIASSDSVSHQRDQEHQASLSSLQKQLDASRHQNEVIRTNVELEVRRRLSEETNRLQGEIHRREVRAREAESHSQQMENAINQMHQAITDSEAEATRLRTTVEEQKRIQLSLSQKVTDSESRCRAYEQQIQAQNGSIDTIRQQLTQQQTDTTRHYQEVIENQKREIQRQAEAYEMQTHGLRNHLEQMTERERQRVHSIKNRMASAQTELQTLTQSFRLTSPYTPSAIPMLPTLVPTPVPTSVSNALPVSNNELSPSGHADYSRYVPPMRQANRY